MNAMKCFLLRIPEAMSNEIDQIAGETYCTKSSFIRQSIIRNLDVCRHVEIPAIREHYRKRLPNLD